MSCAMYPYLVIAYEKVENTEFNVDVSRMKLPIAIKMPIMRAGFGESVSAALISGCLFSVISAIIFSRLAQAFLPDIDSLYFV